MLKTRLSKEERIDFKQKVIDALLTQPIFEGFKYIKADEAIVKKTKFGYQKVPMYFHWESYSKEKQALAFTIMHIGYYIRFDVLHKWFEKYSFKTLKDQRGSYSIGVAAFMLGFKEPSFPDSYDFVYSGEDFEENLAKMVKDIVEIATYFFNKYKSLEDLYEALIVPVLEGKKELPNGGADWIFEYLTLTKMIDNKNYNILKNMIYKERINPHEPNIARYYDKLDEIFEYLEALEVEMPPEFPSIG